MNAFVLRALAFGTAVFAIGNMIFPSAPGIAQENRPLRVGINPVVADAEAYYALDLGLFRKAGLTVTLQSFSGGAAIAAAVAAGELDIGVSNPLSLAIAVTRGIPFKAIAPGYLYDTAEPLSRVVASTVTDVRTPKDLNGKVLCGIAVGGMDQLAFTAWLDRNGGDSTGIKFVEIPGTGISEALSLGRVSACTLSEPYLSDALDKHRVRAIGKAYDAFAPTFMMAVFFSTADWAAKNPTLARRFAAAVVEASVWASTHPEDAAAIVERNTKTKIARVHEKPSRVLDPALIQPVLDRAVRYKFLSREMDAGELIWDGAGGSR